MEGQPKAARTKATNTENHNRQSKKEMATETQLESSEQAKPWIVALHPKSQMSAGHGQENSIADLRSPSLASRMGMQRMVPKN